LPTTLPVHRSKDVPEPPGTAVELRVQERLVELVVAARLTVPLNPLIAATEIVELPATPTLVETLTGLAVMAKSWTWYVTVAL
jgi:hypothetical protein